MSWVTNAIKSSIGRKFLVACTGLLLCGFLVAHLIGNLLMYIGPEVYNNYAHTLHSQEYLIKIAEVGLLVLFIAHLWLAIEASSRNRAARQTRYAVKKSKLPNRKIPYAITPENYMLVSGIIVLIFLCIHLGDFTFNLTMPEKIAGLEPYDKAIVIMRSPVSAIAYVIGSLLLMWHLWHGATSMFQTLGLRHPKYDGLTQNFGPVFATIIGLGFATFPIYAWLVPYNPPAPNPDAPEAHGEPDSHSMNTIPAWQPASLRSELPG